LTMAVGSKGQRKRAAGAVICAARQHSAAAAAYARRGGMRAFVINPRRLMSQGKLAQALGTAPKSGREGTSIGPFPIVRRSWPIAIRSPW